MATKLQAPFVAYGRNTGSHDLFAQPIVINRAPTVADQGEIGQLWVNPSGATAYVLTSIAQGVNTWSVAPTGGVAAATFTINPGDLTVTAGSVIVTAGDVTATGGTTSLDVLIAGDSTINGALGVNGVSTFNGDVTITGATVFTGGFTLNDPNAVSLTSTDNHAGAITLEANGGVLETVLITSQQGTSDASIDIVSVTGGVTLTAATNLVLNAVGTITETSVDNSASAISLIANGGAAETIVINAVQGTTAQAVSLIATAGGITASAATNIVANCSGTATITSLDNAAGAVALVANGGANETVYLHSTQGTGVASINAVSTAGGITLSGALASVHAINLTATNAVGGITMTAGAGGNIVAGNAITTGLITIGGIHQTGAITLGSSDGINIVNVGTGAGATTIHMADGAGVNTVTIGSNAGASTTTIQAGTNGIQLLAAGSVNITPAHDIQASPSATTALAANIGQVNFTGFTTAAAGTQVFTFTNALVALTSAIFVTVSNTGANDAQMTITRVTPAAGRFTVTCTNNGAQALNGTVSISFMIFN